MNAKQIKELVKEMTLEEKASLCSGRDNWNLKGVERLGIPSIKVADGPHGLRVKDPNSYEGIEGRRAVCFPSACCTAASFDEQMLGRLGDLLGEECVAEGIDILLGPAVNIKRSPLNGRNFEYFSEDPYLTGKLAAAYIKGVQKRGVGTSLKHYAANNQETRRTTVSIKASERTMREIYLRQFEIAVKEAGPYTVMAAYNRIDGVFSAQSEWLLSRVLRREWGYKGFVMSDWGATADRVKGLKAGLDLEMPGSASRVTDKEIVKAVQDGKLKTAVLERAVERILNVIFKVHKARKKTTFDFETHHREATAIAENSIVLLKNEDGILPFKKGERIAFIGEFAADTPYQGGGSSHVTPYRVAHTLSCAQKTVDILYARGFAPENSQADGGALLDEAVNAAKAVDKVALFLGVPSSVESEGYDRADMLLPERQLALVEAVVRANPNAVVLLHNGSPVELPFANKIKGLLETYKSGEGAGEAIANILFGAVNPSGRLPETFPLKLSDNPSYLNFPGDKKEVRYDEGVFLGYRYYATKAADVLFPFGYGLSYTKFNYGGLKLSETSFTNGDSVTASVSVTNAGGADGKETVQLYVSSANKDKIPRPIRELKGFKKIFLKAGETKEVSFNVSFDDLAYFSPEFGGWTVQNDVHYIQIASDAHTVLLQAEIFADAKYDRRITVNDDTTIGELLEHEATRAFAQTVFDRMSGRLLGDKAKDAEASGTTAQDSFWQSVILGWAMRLFKTTGIFDEEKYSSVLNDLNEKLKNEKKRS
ncbi:MAG: glycoside hydrolase family 3 C-terminal domain-containing protein [Clostridiales bacterium]|jgi:beta-glucosidase|nr:glycoside hydrolase family 3 C-terminal domain-containing protein [Clostridiales bacterium]